MLLTKQESERISARNDDLQHWYCCDPDVSLCGRDISELSEEIFEEASCVVCEAMAEGICPLCGGVFKR